VTHPVSVKSVVTTAATLAFVVWLVIMHPASLAVLVHDIAGAGRWLYHFGEKR
jgi:hypothetical protein